MNIFCLKKFMAWDFIGKQVMKSDILLKQSGLITNERILKQYAQEKANKIY